MLDCGDRLALIHHGVNEVVGHRIGDLPNGHLSELLLEIYFND
jgi:hypothetical protein